MNSFRWLASQIQPNARTRIKRVRWQEGLLQHEARSFARSATTYPKFRILTSSQVSRSARDRRHAPALSSQFISLDCNDLRAGLKTNGLTKKSLLQRRHLSLTPSDSPDPPSLLLVLAVVLGLPVSLWVYKCLLLILFQRKIIYMSYAPPGTRDERLADEHVRATIPKGLACEEVRFGGMEGVKLAGLVVRSEKHVDAVERRGGKESLVMYLQGNAGNPLDRIPVFSKLLSAINDRPENGLHAGAIIDSHYSKLPQLNPTIFAPAPRSYWLSSRRTPTQRGLIDDYIAALGYAAGFLGRVSPNGDNDETKGPPIILYGHSLGATVAVHVVVSLALNHQPTQALPLLRRIKALILENPFTSTPDMLRALYPNRWMPYRYLGACVWDRWDVEACVRELYRFDEEVGGEVEGVDEMDADKWVLMECVKEARRILRDALLLVSERDEVVPPWMGKRVWEVCQDRGLGGDTTPTIKEFNACERDLPSSTSPNDARHCAGCHRGGWLKGRLVTNPGALHEDAWTKRRWREVVVGVLDFVGNTGQNNDYRGGSTADRSK